MQLLWLWCSVAQVQQLASTGVGLGTQGAMTASIDETIATKHENLASGFRNALHRLPNRPANRLQRRRVTVPSRTIY